MTDNNDMPDEKTRVAGTTGGRAHNINAVIAVACVVFVGAMVGAAYAAVPLYQLFCQVTGYAGTTARANAAPVKPIDRLVTIRFDANVAKKLPWSLTPETRSLTLKVGEVATVFYRAENQAARQTWGSATFNVTPFEAGSYFSKIDCFCFTEQTLAAGEGADMGVTFFVDPAIAKDKKLDYIKTITLSYTMFPDDPPEEAPVAARPDPQAASKQQL